MLSRRFRTPTRTVPSPRPPARRPGSGGRPQLPCPRRSPLLALLLSAAVCVPLAAQERPEPDPVRPIPEYRRAVESGTRTEAGHPGEDYWQQWSEYRIRARLDPDDRTLEGRTRIAYHNRSPDTLRTLYLHLRQNLHAEGTIRNEPQEITGGMEVERVAVDGVELREGAEERPAWSVRATILELEAPEPVPPGETVAVDVRWGFRIPQAGAGRMGWSGDDLFYLGYWYPQMAVYDDVVGWQTDPYRGRGEFYMGYGRYDVRLEVPEGWVVRATGRLRNAEAVFPDPLRRRLERAADADSVVHVLTREDFGPGSATRDSDDGWLTWHFTAENVRDFAFSATRRSLWDASRTPVGDRDGDGETDHTRVEALYRPDAERWSQVWRYAQHSIDFHSRFTGHPYPWPHMTAVEGGGIIGGGMEYPMMTLMGDYEARGDSALYYVTAHELAHMWLPMVVGTDEKRYAWMDEGTITFLENQARKEFFPGRDHDVPNRREYVEKARSGDEVPVMTWMDYQYPVAGNVPNYDKPGTMLVALRHVLGDDVFREALTTFVNEWAYRHPYPWDLFRTFERVSGRELGWFWRSWYLETWTLDHAVARVEREGDGTVIRVEDQGWGVMPVPLSITLEDGTVLERTIPVDPWLRGETAAEITVETASPVTRVEIDAEGDLPDVDRDDNVWTAPPSRGSGGGP